MANILVIRFNVIIKY